MEEIKNKEPKTYTEAEVQEIVNNATKAAAQQVQKMYNQLQQMDMSNMLNRLGVLLEILKIGGPTFGADFLVECVEEVEGMIYPKEEPEEETKKEEEV